MLKMLGFLDLLAAAGILIMQYGFGWWRLALFLGICLIAKGLIFSSWSVSYIDIAAGIYLIFSIFATYWILSCAFSLFLAQKAVFSFFGN